MTIRQKLPKAPENKVNAGSSLSPKALDLWGRKVENSTDTDNTINIFEQIGYNWWTGRGITAKTVNESLKEIGDKDITVNINSPGGDVFEGLAIYNLLREHKGSVTVKVIGVAASAASFIAMAADEVQIARAGFFMIHNAWTHARGNRNELRDIANFLEQIDETIADIYNIKSGMSTEDLRQQMDSETWISGKNAVENGLADSLLPVDKEDGVEPVENSMPLPDDFINGLQAFSSKLSKIS